MLKTLARFDFVGKSQSLLQIAVNNSYNKSYEKSSLLTRAHRKRSHANVRSGGNGLRRGKNVHYSNTYIHWSRKDIHERIQGAAWRRVRDACWSGSQWRAGAELQKRQNQYQ
jgi:hypothetical protein